MSRRGQEAHLGFRRTLQRTSRVTRHIQQRPVIPPDISAQITVNSAGVRRAGGASDTREGSGVASTSWSSGTTAPLLFSSNRQLSSAAPSYLTAADRSTSLSRERRSIQTTPIIHPFRPRLRGDLQCVCVCVCACKTLTGRQAPGTVCSLGTTWISSVICLASETRGSKAVLR